MKRRHIWVISICTMLAVVGSAVFVTTTDFGDDVVAEGDLPGFDGGPTDPDRSPFQLARPTTTDGPTTIPGAARLGGRRTTTTTTTTTTTPTTTTTIPTAVNLPPPDDITSICGMHDSIFSIQLIWTDPSLDVQQVAEQLEANMVRYVAVSPPEARDEVVGLQETFVTVSAELRRANWNTEAPMVRQLLTAIERQSPPFERFVERMNIIRFFEAATCG